MTKDASPSTSQDYDRKHQQDHVSHNPRAKKDLPTAEDQGASGISEQTADLISKGHTITEKPTKGAGFTEDKRKDVRHEHTNHFTNRSESK